MLKTLYDVLAGQAALEGLAERVGNENLDTGRGSCLPEHANPFPLAEILDSMYEDLEGESAKSG